MDGRPAAGSRDGQRASRPPNASRRNRHAALARRTAAQSRRDGHRGGGVERIAFPRSSERRFPARCASTGRNTAPALVCRATLTMSYARFALLGAVRPGGARRCRGRGTGGQREPPDSICLFEEEHVLRTTGRAGPAAPRFQASRSRAARSPPPTCTFQPTMVTEPGGEGGAAPGPGRQRDRAEGAAVAVQPLALTRFRASGPRDGCRQPGAGRVNHLGARTGRRRLGMARLRLQRDRTGPREHQPHQERRGTQGRSSLNT